MARGRKPTGLLEKPAHKVIRHQAERLLKKADRAVTRLKDPRDKKALHDSRVALRRLRGWFQAFRTELSLKRKQRHALRALAHSTNDARDAEVGVEWLTTLRSRMAPALKPVVAHLSARLARRRDEANRKVCKDLPSAWKKLAHKIDHTAEEVRTRDQSFKKVFGASLRVYAHDFEQARLRARRAPQPRNLHALRIAGKKLRYLVEAGFRSGPVPQQFIREMQALHDSAGAIQDLQRLRAILTADRTSAIGAWGPISRAVRQEQALRIAAFRRAYLGRKPPRCMRELRGILKRFS